MKQTTKAPKNEPATATGGPVKFHTKILQAGKTATGIEIPDEIIEKLGAGKRPPVRVTIRDQRNLFRNLVAVMGGKFLVGVSAENRAKTGVAGGDEVDVQLELDTQPREVTVPPDFAQVLTKNPAGPENIRNPILQQKTSDRRIDRSRQDPGNARPPHRKSR